MKGSRAEQVQTARTSTGFDPAAVGAVLVPQASMQPAH